MDLFVLDENLRRVTLVDQYESLIWTDRYKDVGDFELLIRATSATKQLFLTGTKVKIPDSRRFMEIETVESTVSDNGVSMLKISGRDMVKILENRVARNVDSNLTANPTWNISDILPAALARKVFSDMIVTNTVHPEDKLPVNVTTSTYPINYIVEPQVPITVSLELADVLTTIKGIADVYNFGFRLYLDGEATPVMHFDIYTGNDRTTAQTLFPAVVFSPSMDNLSDTSELSSSAAYMNVAYVYAPNGSLEVWADDTAPEPTGLNRRVLTVKADDITLASGAALTAALKLRGQRELAAHRVVYAFDGEIPQSGSFEYEKHYFLGDLVEVRSADGSLSNNMRVTEQIIVCDAQGKRSYPTLVLDTLITPGTWLSWDANQMWADLGPEYWNQV